MRIRSSLIGLVLSVASYLPAADMRPWERDIPPIHVVGLVIEGDIVAGDHDRFMKAVEQGGGRIGFVYLLTNGGDFSEAMKIGRSIRKLQLATMAPDRNDRGGPWLDPNGAFPSAKDPKNINCASAGFFLWIAGVFRDGRYVAVHRPYYGPAQLASMTREAAEAAYRDLQKQAAAYMSEMGAPQSLQERVFATSADDIYVLDDVLYKTVVGDLPERTEWLAAKEGTGLTAAERERFQKLILMDEEERTPRQNEELSRLRRKSDEQWLRRFALMQEAWQTAFKAAFPQTKAP